MSGLLMPKAIWGWARRRFDFLRCALAAAPLTTFQSGIWYLLGKRVRAKNAFTAAASLHPAFYRYWTRYVDLNTCDIGLDYCKKLEISIWEFEGVPSKCELSPPVGFSSRFTSEAILRDKLGEHSRRSLGSLERVWILPRGTNSRISAAVPKCLNKAVADRPDARLIFWDEDFESGSERYDPWLKATWDELIYLAAGGLLGACAIRGDILLSAMQDRVNVPSRWREPDGLIAGIVQRLRDEEIVHIPQILTHRAEGEDGPSLTRHLDGVIREWVGLETFEWSDSKSQRNLVPRFPLREPAPTVSIIIPSRDQAELLGTCLAGISATSYPGRIEVIVVDNGSADPIALRLLAALPERGIRVLSHGGDFNFSKLNNLAVASASGEFVCLLNNDIEVVQADWLTEMMRYAVRPKTGAVGALLLYPDRTVQHAGVVIGIGGAAGHVYRGLAFDATGHRTMHRTSRRVSAVTAACMVVRRDYYLQVGGMDEAHFKVAFNDVDLCLKLEAAGLRNIFAAQAVLIHHESKSRGHDDLPKNRARFAEELSALRRIWNTETAIDPYYSPLFLRTSEHAVLGE